MNKGIHSLWPNRVLINNINNKELLENFTNSVLQESDLDKPFNAMQDICIFKDGSKTFKQFRDEIVLPAFNEYLDLIDSILVDPRITALLTYYDRIQVDLERMYEIKDELRQPGMGQYIEGVRDLFVMYLVFKSDM